MAVPARIHNLYLLRPLFFLSLVFLLASGAGAQQNQQNGSSNRKPEYVEPIITEETLPNEVGEWDFRFTSEYARDTGNIRSGLLPRFHTFFGILRNLGADFDGPLVYRKDSSSSYGLGDVSVGLKWLLAVPAGRRPAVVLGLETTFPTGRAARHLGEGTYELEPFLALLQDFRRVLVQGNVGVSNRILTSAADPDEEKRAFTYNWAVAFPFRDHTLHLLAEVNGEVGLQHGQRIAAFSPGFKYRLNEQMFVAVATPVGLTRDTKKLGVVVQFQVGVGSRE